MPAEDHPGTLPKRVLESRFFRFENDKEVYEMFRPAPDVIVMQVLGYSCAEAAVHATKSVEKEFGDRPFSVFADFTAVMGYEPAARRVLASWVTAHAKQVKVGWFCTDSKVVEMGISVGSMIVSMVGVKIEVADYETWLAALEEAMNASNS